MLIKFSKETQNAFSVHVKPWATKIFSINTVFRAKYKQKMIAMMIKMRQTKET